MEIYLVISVRTLKFLISSVLRSIRSTGQKVKAITNVTEYISLFALITFEI
jgi:hypothetical protein